jgi:hypothetical protein
MKKLLLFVLLALSALSAPANAQQASSAFIVSSCGTLPAGLTYAAGQFGILTMDTTGKLCDSATGGGGGGGAVTAASGSYASGALSSGSVVDLGSQADAACGTATGTCSLIALQKFNNTATGSPVPTQDASVSLGGVGIVPTALAAGGITPVVCGSAVSSCVFKASAGNLYSAYAECTAACWLMVFNSTSAPSNGATTAGVASGNLVECIDISAGSSKSIAFAGMPPEVYSVGITAAISSTACATLTLSTVAFVKGSVK